MILIHDWMTLLLLDLYPGGLMFAGCFLESCLRVDLMSRIYTCCVSQKYFCLHQFGYRVHVSISVRPSASFRSRSFGQKYLDDWMTRCIVRCTHEARAKLHLHKWWTHERKTVRKQKGWRNGKSLAETHPINFFCWDFRGPFSICISVLILTIFWFFHPLCLFTAPLKLATGLPMELTKRWIFTVPSGGLYRSFAKVRGCTGGFFVWRAGILRRFFPAGWSSPYMVVV